MTTAESIRAKLKEVIDPELNMDILTLGLVYDVKAENGNAIIDLTLTTPMCPFGPQLIEDVKKQVGSIEGISEVTVNLVWEPPWGPDRMSEEAKLQLGIT